MSPGVDLKGDQFEWELQTGPHDHFEQADCTEWGEGGVQFLPQVPTF